MKFSVAFGLTGVKSGGRNTLKVGRFVNLGIKIFRVLMVSIGRKKCPFDNNVSGGHQG